MNSDAILRQLRAHVPFDERENEMRRAIERFVEENERWHDRALTIGHLTGSAWVLDEERTHALLTHHRKLDVWVQLGGHTEGDADMLSAAWREAREESGLPDVAPLSDAIFDVDIHAIPARPGEPAHFHYDIRYLFAASRRTPLTVSRESKDLAWVHVDRIADYTQEESVLRMIRKTQVLIDKKLFTTGSTGGSGIIHSISP